MSGLCLLAEPLCLTFRPLWSHLLQAAAAGLLDELLCIHFLSNIVPHIQGCLLEELGRSMTEESSEVLLMCISVKETGYKREAFILPSYRGQTDVDSYPSLCVPTLPSFKKQVAK